MKALLWDNTEASPAPPSRTGRQQPFCTADAQHLLLTRRQVVCFVLHAKVVLLLLLLGVMVMPATCMALPGGHQSQAITQLESDQREAKEGGEQVRSSQALWGHNPVKSKLPSRNTFREEEEKSIDRYKQRRLHGTYMVTGSVHLTFPATVGVIAFCLLAFAWERVLEQICCPVTGVQRNSGWAALAGSLT